MNLLYSISWVETHLSHSGLLAGAGTGLIHMCVTLTQGLPYSKGQQVLAE